MDKANNDIFHTQLVDEIRFLRQDLAPILDASQDCRASVSQVSTRIEALGARIDKLEIEQRKNTGKIALLLRYGPVALIGILIGVTGGDLTQILNIVMRMAGL